MRPKFTTIAFWQTDLLRYQYQRTAFNNELLKNQNCEIHDIQPVMIKKATVF